MWRSISRDNFPGFIWVGAPIHLRSSYLQYILQFDHHRRSKQFPHFSVEEEKHVSLVCSQSCRQAHRIRQFLTSAHIAIAMERISRFRVHIAPIVAQGLSEHSAATTRGHRTEHARFRDVSLSLHDNMEYFINPSEPHFVTCSGSLAGHTIIFTRLSPVYPRLRNPLQCAA